MDRHILCNKQPILDPAQKLYSYSYDITPIGAATLTDQALIDEAQDLFRELDEKVGLDTLAGPRNCFYRVPYPLLAQESLPQLSDPKKLIIEIDVDILGNKPALQALKTLRAEGHQICLANYTPDEAHDKLLKISQFVKLNRALLGDRLIPLHQQLQAEHTVIVTHVEDEAQFQALKTQGVTLFQGFYFVNPVITADKELSANEAAIMRLLSEINHEDTDFDKLIDIISADVALSHHLLTAINHPANNLPRQVESIEDAVKLMGLKRLKFWVTMMALNKTEGVPSELMLTALVRGKFMEQLAEHSSHKKEKDSYFLVGMFSTLNAFFHLPMVDLLAQLPLAEPLKEALINLKGEMGKALRIVRALEGGSTDWQSLQFENQDIMAISNHYMTANGWARQVLDSIQ